MNTADYIGRFPAYLTKLYICRRICNSTTRINNRINATIKVSISTPEEMKERLMVRDPKTPLLYGLQKIERTGCSTHPVVSAVGSKTYPIVIFLAQKLQLHVGYTISYFKNSDWGKNYGTLD